jgi:tetrahydromethanopterin S-methyltransferase subunit F
MQAITDNNSLYTREEQLVGGADTNTTYGLQINEANESDF